MSKICVRIAPSPTGIPHTGNTRTALFNFLFARRKGGKFILRIEDTDQKRIVPGAKEAIFEILEWLEIPPDKMYVQSKRLDIYKRQVLDLLKKGSAVEDEGAIRFVVPKGKILEWQDAVGSKKISFKSEDIEDFVILKSDGFPTYHLASVVDDHLMEISHVIRGVEWISSTPKHLLLYEAFGWTPPTFAHLPLILGSDKTKLSKRHGAKSVLDYRREGYLKEALLNFMALLGWNPGGDKEIMSLEEMIDLFDLKDINTASPIFDPKKLEWMNGVYIRKSQILNLKSQILYQNPKLKEVDQSLLEKIIPLAQTRMTTLNDFYELVRFFFEEQKIILSKEEKEIGRKVLEQFSTIKKWESGEILNTLKVLMASESVHMSFFYKILTGREAGLPLPQSLEILGKAKVLSRLKKIL